MKMVKSLLLGTAAGLVAMTGAQAADLPVKAKPVQYVKICSLYGAGFYYIPGTDTCIKIGGYVRTEWMYNAGGSFTPIVNDVFDRTMSDVENRSRGIITADARSQTEYGTLRGYLSQGFSRTNSGTAEYSHRAFIQLAGFTLGLTRSFFDDFSFASVSNQTNYLGSDTGGGGTNTWAYTAQLGNGMSASVAVEDPMNRRTLIGGSDVYGGQHLPNFVGNLRVSQAWGSAQVMGAINEVYPGQLSAATHHDSKLGYAVGAGVKVNLPMLGKGDFVAGQFIYASGATGYNIRAATFSMTKGGTIVSGVRRDAVCGTIAQGCELTKSWTALGAFQHGWNAHWKTSIYGGYDKVDYGTTAETILGGAAGSHDWSFYQIGSRTVWTPVKNLDLSVDVMYNNLKGSPALQVGTATQEHIWSGIFRAQRNFWP